MSHGIFLPVGHTHFEIDGVASRITTAMKYRDVTALSELESILEGCNNPSPFVDTDTIEAVTDISDSEGDADADVDVEEELEEESSEEDFGN